MGLLKLKRERVLGDGGDEGFDENGKERQREKEEEEEEGTDDLLNLKSNGRDGDEEDIVFNIVTQFSWNF